MELSFNELEQRLLRFLKQEFLEKGSEPQTMLDPETMHIDIMQKFGLDLLQYREVMARQEHRGRVRVIAIGAPNGRLQFTPWSLRSFANLTTEQPNRSRNLTGWSKPSGILSERGGL